MRKAITLLLLAISGAVFGQGTPTTPTPMSTAQWYYDSTTGFKWIRNGKGYTWPEWTQIGGASGGTYTAGYGLGLTSFQFRVDSTLQASKSWAFAAFYTKAQSNSNYLNLSGATNQTVLQRPLYNTGINSAGTITFTSTAGNGALVLNDQTTQPTAGTSGVTVLSHTSNGLELLSNNGAVYIGHSGLTGSTIYNLPVKTGTQTFAMLSDISSSGGGTVLSVSSANTDISVATPTSTPVLTLNSGTGANQIAKRDGSGNFNATTVTTNANLTGPITSVGNTTTINNINGITPTFYDPTSSIQTQLNGKASSTGYTPNSSITTSASGALQTSRIQRIIARYSTGQNVPLPANTYSNGTAGVGATLTATANGILTPDGAAVQVGDLLLVAGETTTANNGVYDVTQVGSASLPYILTRDPTATNPLNLSIGTQVYITAGTAFKGYTYNQLFAGTVVIGTTSLVYNSYVNTDRALIVGSNAAISAVDATLNVYSTSLASTGGQSAASFFGNHSSASVFQQDAGLFANYYNGSTVNTSKTVELGGNFLTNSSVLTTGYGADFILPSVDGTSSIGTYASIHIQPGTIANVTNAYALYSQTAYPFLVNSPFTWQAGSGNNPGFSFVGNLLTTTGGGNGFNITNNAGTQLALFTTGSVNITPTLFTNSITATGTLANTGAFSNTGNATVTGVGTIGPATSTQYLPSLTLQGLAVNNAGTPTGGYGGLKFSSNSAFTGNARNFWLTNALNGNSFALLMGTAANTDPTLGTSGALTAGTSIFTVNQTGLFSFTSSPSIPLTGILKGNGTSAVTVATAGTDYQVPISLTTTGTSGAATFVSGVLNVPNYTTTGGVTSFNTRTGSVVPASGDYTTSIVPEGSNLYFTNARSIASTLTGYVAGAGTVSSSDGILSALQKIDGNDGLKAPLASPAFTGIPTAPTAAAGTSTTQVASTAFVTGSYLPLAGVTPMFNTFSSSSASQSLLNLYPTISQTGTGSWAAENIFPFISSQVGNGYLINAGTASAANGGGTLTSLFSVSSTGGIIATGGNISGQLYAGTGQIYTKLNIGGTNYNLGAQPTFGTALTILPNNVQVGGGATTQSSAIYVDQQTFNSPFTGAVLTNAYSLLIGASPIGSANLTITNSYALGVVGNSIFTGNVAVSGSLTSPSIPIYGNITLVAGVGTATVTGATTSSKATTGFVSVGGTVTTTWQYKVACTANTITITAINNSNATNTADTSTLTYSILK